MSTHKLDFRPPPGWALYWWPPELVAGVVLEGLRDRRWGNGAWEFSAVGEEGQVFGPVLLADLVYRQALGTQVPR